MKPVRKLELRREMLATLDTDEARQVGGQAVAQTPECTIFSIPVVRCLSYLFVDCPLG